MAKRSDVKRAIKCMSEYRQIHLDWAKYFEEWPEQEEKYKETVDDRLGQLKIVKEYDRVIALLKELDRPVERQVRSPIGAT